MAIIEPKYDIVPKVSLCMIVKNEEVNLPVCLESVKGLFDEIIIVDTGSTDRTKDIAREYGAKVSDFEWIDDFSAARNKSLELATGQWIFWLDADHRVDKENYEKLKSLFSQLKEEKIAYQMHELSLVVGLPSTHLQPRLFLRNPKIRWRYRVHEQTLLPLAELGYRLENTSIVIHHYGYTDSTITRKKNERNIRLLEMELEEKPNDILAQSHDLYYLSRTYRGVDRIDLSLPAILKGIEVTPKNSSYYYRLYLELIEVYIALGRLEDALNVCKTAQQFTPPWADFLCWESVVWEKLGNSPNALNCLYKLLDSIAVFQSTDLLLIDKIHYLIGQHYYKQGDEDKAAKIWLELMQNSPNFAFSWLSMIDLRMKQKRWEEALQICNKAINLMPSVADFLFIASLIYTQFNKLADAKACLLKLQQPSLFFYNIHQSLTPMIIKHNLGVLSFNLGEILEAEHHWLEVVNKTPDYFRSWEALIELWILQKRPSEIARAISSLEQHQKKDIANAIKTYRDNIQKENLHAITVLKKFITDETTAS